MGPIAHGKRRESPPRRARIRALLLLGVGGVVVTTALVLLHMGVLSARELATVDARFALRVSEPAADDVVVVVIDSATLAELDVTWPIPRALHGRAIDRLREEGVRAIAYDIAFGGRKTGNAALLEAAARARGRVVFGAEPQDVDAFGRVTLFGDRSLLARYGARAGYRLLPLDLGRVTPDESKLGGVARRLRQETFGVPALAVVAAGLGGRPVDTRVLAHGPAWIDFAGPPGTVETVSFADLLAGRTRPGLFSGRIAVVGVDQPDLLDRNATSVSASPMLSAEIHANAISTALRGFPLRDAPPATDVVLVVLLGLLAPVAALQLRAWRTLGVATTGGVLFLAGAQVAFEAGLIVAVVYPLGALGLATAGTLGVHVGLASLERERILQEAFERARLRGVFSRFLPQPVVEDLLLPSEDGLKLGGVEAVGTVMITDLRDFSGFSESRSAELVINMLNHYFTEVSDAILAQGGTLISYTGDGVLAVFGAPIEQVDHADRALAAAREILDDRLPRFNDWLRSQQLGDGFRMGIGVNTGSFVAGNVGSERRIDYTAIGDTINTASRIEGLTKGTPHALLLSDSTRRALRRRPRDLCEVGLFPVRGRDRAVRLWSVGPASAGSLYAVERLSA